MDGIKNYKVEESKPVFKKESVSQAKNMKMSVKDIR